MFNSHFLVVLTYHYIRNFCGLNKGIHPVSLTDFECQLNLLLEKFNKLEPEELNDFLRKETSLKKNSFLLTFDDGLKDHYENVLNILNRYKIKGIFFISTSPIFENKMPVVHKIHFLRSILNLKKFISILTFALPSEWKNYKLSDKQVLNAEKTYPFDTLQDKKTKYFLNFILPSEVIDSTTSKMLKILKYNEKELCNELFLTKEQIVEIHNDGHIIGLHGNTHETLSKFNKKKLKQDLQSCQNYLNSILGFEPSILSYPYGRKEAIPFKHLDVLDSLRIKDSFTLFTGINDLNTDRKLLKRYTPNQLFTKFNNDFKVDFT